MAKNKQPVRILVADDHAIFRDGLRRLLEGDEDVTIVGEASNGAECIKMLAKLKPDILLLDLRMPDKDGLAVRSEEHTSELQSRLHLVCRLLLEKKNPCVHWRALQSPIRIRSADACLASARM